MDFPRHLLPGPLRSRDAGISDLSPRHVCQILPPSTSGSWRNTLYAIPVFPDPMDWPRTAPLVSPLSTAQNQAGLPFLLGNLNDAVIYVRNILYQGDFVAQVFKVALGYHGDYVGTGVAQMYVVVDSGAAKIHCYVVAVARDELPLPLAQ